MKTGGVAWRARPYSFLCFCELDREKGRRREPRVGKWETWFWFSTSPSGAKPGGGNVGISRCWRDFQGPVGSVGNLLLVFHSPHGPAISTAIDWLQKVRGGMGDSDLHRRNSLAFAALIFLAQSVSLIAVAKTSRRSKLSPTLRHDAASGSDFNFS